MYGVKILKEDILAELSLDEDTEYQDQLLDMLFQIMEGNFVYLIDGEIFLVMKKKN